MTEVWVVTESGHEHTAVIAVAQSLEAAKAIGNQHQAAYLNDKRRTYEHDRPERWTLGDAEWKPCEHYPRAVEKTLALWRGSDWDSLTIFPVPLDTYGGGLGWPYGPHSEHDSDD